MKRCVWCYMINHVTLHLLLTKVHLPLSCSSLTFKQLRPPRRHAYDDDCDGDVPIITRNQHHPLRLIVLNPNPPLSFEIYTEILNPKLLQTKIKC